MEALAARAFERRAFEAALEAGRVQLGQSSELWINQIQARLHASSYGDRSPSVPRTDILADVAAEDLAADGGAKILGDAAFFLDGEIGDAAGGVHLARCDECVGGAGVDAAGARAAAVGGGGEG